MHGHFRSSSYKEFPGVKVVIVPTFGRPGYKGARDEAAVNWLTESWIFRLDFYGPDAGVALGQNLDVLDI